MIPELLLTVYTLKGAQPALNDNDVKSGKGILIISKVSLKVLTQPFIPVAFICIGKLFMLL